ncbi:glutamate synthase [Endozoicomonas montiporae]|uniref:Glutamate synthase n=2 Tax=Endozoicomonas montiporae TaxID=1027273 RepID=A0A081N5G8_9GAMM|nr:NAD(P)-binding protein [Endozoicomonas montiporae]AMO57422.1 pyruvic-ferredoxin oxidoreductase subunit delta [Endozoicomonas montiporae CL-33]KEQ13691.1 glutamate synthase [Endozoicomonas montiporae]
MQRLIPFATTLEPGSSRSNKTGSWRSLRPEYVKNLPPCNDTCPAGENIQGWLSHAQRGDFHAAWQEIVQNNPLPATMGRVCYHPCQSGCNRKMTDGSVQINATEKFIGDTALEHGWQFERPQKLTGQRVLVIGGGPGGLSAAYHLRRAGHSVTIYEAMPDLGGMLRYGIPSYRLPREVLNAEITRILAMGVEVRTNTRVHDIQEVMRAEGFHAVFTAVGNWMPSRVDVKTTGDVKVLDGIEVLRKVETGEDHGLKGSVVVWGGGNTAIDVARVALRITGKRPKMIIRRDMEHMRAHQEEIDDALAEGVEFFNLHTIDEVREGEIVLERMEADDRGRPFPTGKYLTVAADSVVMALGQSAELGVMEKMGITKAGDWEVPVSPGMMTSVPGIFAGGDMVPSIRTVTAAIGHGKKAARNIDLWLNDKPAPEPVERVIASFDLMNTDYYPPANSHHRPKLDADERIVDFREVKGDFTEEQAIREAHRCMSCGNCMECDNCYGFCPDNAIKKLGKDQGFEIDHDYCKGCGVCATECPLGAIEMVAETI